MKKILITAGPTREMIDPVRFLSNRSSGKMGYALAAAAQAQGLAVTLISGPSCLTPPPGIRTLPVISAEAMYQAVMANLADQDIFIAAAAVSDYRPIEVYTQKLKKNEETLTLKLTRTRDILLAVSQSASPPFLVGFAAETNALIQNASKKQQQKNLDMIIANQVSDTEGFEQDDNAAILLTKTQEMMTFEKQSKTQLAEKIIREILRACERHTSF